MSYKSILEQFDKIIANPYREEYYRFTNDLLEKASDFLIAKVPTLAQHFDKDKINELLTPRAKQDELSQFIEIVQAHPNKQLREQALEFIPLAHIQTVNTIKVFSAFIEEEDYTTFLKYGDQNFRRILGNKIELIKHKLLSKPDDIKSLLILFFGSKQEQHAALLDLISPINNTHISMEDAISVAQQRIYEVSYLTPCITEETLNSLNSSVREGFLSHASQLPFREEQWPHAFELLESYGYFAANTKYLSSPEILETIKVKIQNLDSIPCALAFLTYSGHSSYEKRTFLDAAELVVLKHADTLIAKNELTENLEKNIYHRRLVELLFPIANTEQKNRLAQNYFRKQENGENKLEIDWKFVEQNIEILASAFFHRMRGNDTLPMERLDWFWNNINLLQNKYAILNFVYNKITPHTTPDTNNEEYERWFLKHYNSDLENFDSDRSMSFTTYSYYGQNDSIARAEYMWPHFGPKIRTYIAETINESYNDNTGEKSPLATLCTLSSEHSLIDLVANPSSDNWTASLLIYTSDASFSDFLQLLPKIEKSTASVKYAARGLANVSPQRIEAEGLYTHAKKNIREAAQWSLTQTQHPATSLIEDLLNNKKVNWMTAIVVIC